MKKFLSLFILLLLFSIFIASAKEDRSFLLGKQISIFNSLFRELDLNYVDTLNYDKVMKSAIDNMLSETDPYTVYIPEEKTADLKFMTTGEYAGVGALISKHNNEICISDPYEGMPAQKNDVRSGDVILEIDGKKTEGLSVSEVSSLLKGAPNTEVHLKLKRIGSNKPIEKKFKREKIVVKSITYSSVVAPQVGYVLLNDFTDHSAIELKEIVQKLVEEHKIQSLVLDLRGNGGGLIDESVKILGFFLPKGTEVVSTKGILKQAERVYKTPTEPIFPTLQLAVLANGNSASASEIVAGAVQDLDRGIVVGERTFGKGLVQNIRTLPYGGHLKVTTAKYYIPSGRCIQAVDYAHRSEDGAVVRVPDSLTNEFKTRNGRSVRDGGGIVPDTITVKNRKLNVAYYILMQDLYFDYANEYVSTHPAIAPPSSFALSDKDFDDFTSFLQKRNFTYTSQTEKYFNQLLEAASYEGLDTIAKKEFDALKLSLKPDIKTSLSFNKAEIVELLSLELIKRYYFQRGEVEFALRDDTDLDIAVEILNNSTIYNRMLGVK